MVHIIYYLPGYILGTINSPKLSAELKWFLFLFFYPSNSRNADQTSSFFQRENVHCGLCLATLIACYIYISLNLDIHC